ncbi:hypothetical protein TcasGA2_TC010718 [Tribolium castaneum]|uniref:Uncharacterized protein n=1 Tax=Tribolium castaneum TaxID=7070 RepID=D7EJU4_TRICA|nr:hypothetical protein TcasGA2_TC010718 [Tribolium castaneum]
MTSLFKGCLALGFISEVWRKMKVVFIAKQGRSQYAVAKSVAQTDYPYIVPFKGRSTEMALHDIVSKAD